MLANLEAEMSAYMLHLKQAGYSTKIIDSNRRCYESLHAHLSANNLKFTMETALQWLESRKAGWSYGSYCAYRNSLFRFEKYLIDGSVSRIAVYADPIHSK